MPIDKQHDPKDREGRKAARPEFEVAYYTKELGRPLQRRMLERQLAAFSADANAAADHHDDALPQTDGSPPRDDRAG
jgi:hypothetical protein